MITNKCACTFVAHYSPADALLRGIESASVDTSDIVTQNRRHHNNYNYYNNAYNDHNGYNRRGGYNNYASYNDMCSADGDSYTQYNSGYGRRQQGNGKFRRKPRGK